jgi:hypothetical protein
MNTAMNTVTLPRKTVVSAVVTRRFNRFPELAFTAAVGVFLCAVANAMSRATESPSPLIYWAGVLVIALPIFYRLTGQDLSARDRLALVCLLGLSLYAVKLVRDAPIFTFSDEFIHAWNSNQISHHHHLFHASPVLEISRWYPGLEGATSALRGLTGLNAFAAGAIVVGAARLLMSSAMFVAFWRVSRSDRIAGIGAALFACNFNYLFWSAQYSYESLALPLLMLVILAVTELDLGPRAARTAWRVLAGIAIAAIVITHHITSYATAGILVAISAASSFRHRIRNGANPWPLAALAVGLTILWLFVVASATVGYLSPVIGGAVKATIDTAAGEGPSRGLFQGTNSVIGPTPVIARAISLLAVLILFAALPFGLRNVWRRYRAQPMAVIFAIASVAFFGALAMRLAPASWETGNRASEFLFIGLAFVVACVGLERWRPPSFPLLGRVLMVGAFAIVLTGGAISGWPWDMQLSPPARAKAADGGGTISSPPLAMAEWAAEQVQGGRFGAMTADSRLLLDPGEKTALTDYAANIVEIIPATELQPWALPLLREDNIRYVVADQRLVAEDGIRGYFFETPGSPRDTPLSPKVITKFEGLPGVAKIYDNGRIAVFDLDAPVVTETPATATTKAVSR